MSGQPLNILGASARAASFSAHRAGYTPYWIDQYGDHDLAARFAGQQVPVDCYPSGIPALLAAAPAAPFLYTGAMENHLPVLETLAQQGTLLGNSAAVCRAVRDPQQLLDCFKAAGIAHPGLALPSTRALRNKNDWLLKHRQSAGGHGVSRFSAVPAQGSTRHYLQQYISGESRAGIFLADGDSAWLLGVSRQLVGESFLHAAEFAYCGSIGPLSLEENESLQWQAIGSALTAVFGLKGLFGVDAICQAGTIYPLEVNPRYTASVEVIELALGVPLVSWHCEACLGGLRPPVLPAPTTMIAKAYLFAGSELKVPEDVGRLYNDSADFSLTADIPRAGSRISRGHPLMTILARTVSVETGLQELGRRSKLLYEDFAVV